MPIRPEHRFFYPIDWLQLSAVIRVGRARGCCEGCGHPHGRMVYQLEQDELAELSSVSAETIKRLWRLNGPPSANSMTLAGL